MAPFCQIYRVTDEALIAETAVWPNFFLMMNVFFALKGSKIFIIIGPHLSDRYGLTVNLTSDIREKYHKIHISKENYVRSGNYHRSGLFRSDPVITRALLVSLSKI